MRPFGEHQVGSGLAIRPWPGGLALRSAAMIVALAFPTAAPGQGPGDGPELGTPTGSPAPAASDPLPAPDPKPTPDPLRSPTPTPTPAPARPRRAVMAVPGLMGPSSPRSTITSTPLPPPAEAPGAPALDGPLEMPGPPPASRPRLGPLPGTLGRTAVRDSSSLDDGPIVVDPPVNGPGTSARRASRGRPTGDSTASTIPPPAPRARGRFFGLVPGPGPAPARTPPLGGPSTSSLPGRATVDDLKPEAAADSTLRARIERQANMAVGDRARSIDVRVDGRRATVRARGVKFLQKRGVRKSLESLPALSGLRSTIDVLD